MNFYFDQFKGYSQFLLRNQDIFEELATAYIKKIRSSNTPLMRFLESLPFEEHKKVTDKNIERFLQHSLNDTAFEDSIVVIDQWKSGELLGLPREEIEITDILTVSNIRKQTYIDFLDKYTLNLSLFRSIVAELDGFHMQFEKYAFDSYVEIHQEELANENQFTSSMINSSVDGILAFDKNLIIREFNQVLERWHGIKKEDVIGKEILKVFSAYSGSIEGNPVMKALNGEKTFIPENPFADRKGYYEANIVPLYDIKGKITGGIIITHDVTKRKEADEEIKRTKNFLQEVTDAVPNVIYVSDFATKKVVFVNKEVSSLAGYTSEEVKLFDRERLESLIHPNDLPALEKETKEISNLKNGEVSFLNFRIRHKVGNWRWIRTKSKVFKHNEKGEPLQTLRVFEDVTEIVEAQHRIQQQNGELAASNEELAAALEEWQSAEEQLREINDELEHRVERRTRELAESERNVKQSEEQLRLITDAVPALISYLRNDRTLGFVNAAYEKLFQVKREDVLGKPVKDIIGEKAYHNSLPLMEKALSGEYTESEILQDYGPKVGKMWRRASFVPHKVEGEIVGAFVLVEDITKLKNIQLEQEELVLQLMQTSKQKEKALKQLEKKNKDLKRTNTDLDNFIYTASHDLKAPITNLEGLMAILKKSVSEKVDANKRGEDAWDDGCFRSKASQDYW